MQPFWFIITVLSAILKTLFIYSTNSCTMENLFIESTSRYDFEQTIEKLSGIILNGGWNISVILDLQASLNKSGIEVLPVKVIELCNPSLASRILQNSDTRIYSSMLPCKISVYVKDNGKTFLSILNSGELSTKIGGTVESVMTEAFSQVEKFIQQISDNRIVELTL
jgi:uncharacterized protein (DUF302 family)